MSLMAEVGQKAFNLGVPLAIHLDVTYRCNERCVHCYLDHDDHGEMTTAEIKDVLDQLAEAGVFFLTLSGGEVFMRRDFFEILEHARRLLFNVKIKTNAVMIGEAEAARIARRSTSIRFRSASTRIVPRFTMRSPSCRTRLSAPSRPFEFLRDQGLRVTIANVLMTANLSDQYGTQKLAAELGVHYTLDPTITPMMDGDMSVLALRIAGRRAGGGLSQSRAGSQPGRILRARRAPPSEEDLEGYSCSAGHSFCYISPYGDVFPVRAVSAADRKYSAAEISGYLESLAADERGALDSGARSDDLLVVLARRRVARAARAWLTWKEICAARRPRIARSRFTGPACRPRICCSKAYRSRGVSCR